MDYSDSEELYGDMAFSESIDPYIPPYSDNGYRSVKQQLNDMKNPYRTKTGIVEHIKNHNKKLKEKN